MKRNPFIISGYAGPEYFCDRVKESKRLADNILNNRNTVIISPRRMGKSGLIEHCINQYGIRKTHKVFIIDIYPTKNLQDFTTALSEAIIRDLQPSGEKALRLFLNVVSSISVSMASAGMQDISLGLQKITDPELSLKQIFDYLGKSKEPCVVAFDEFQQIAKYPEKNIEALLRTYIQKQPANIFIFAGSQRHMINEMFNHPDRPFYMSTDGMHLEAIQYEKYAAFVSEQFNNADKGIDGDTIKTIYDTFDGTTWYLQKIFNELYSDTDKGETADTSKFRAALDLLLKSRHYEYEEDIYKLPVKQRDLLIAIAKEGKASGITSEDFAVKYGFKSTATLQAAKRALLEKEYITEETGTCMVYNKFLGLWLAQQYC